MFSRNGAIHGVRMLVFLPFLCSIFHDNSAASSFAHAPLLACKHAGNSNARAQCTEISIPKRDGHTYIHTYIPTQNEMRSRISCFALRRSAIMFKSMGSISSLDFTENRFLIFAFVFEIQPILFPHTLLWGVLINTYHSVVRAQISMLKYSSSNPTQDTSFFYIHIIQ